MVCGEQQPGRNLMRLEPFGSCLSHLRFDTRKREPRRFSRGSCFHGVDTLLQPLVFSLLAPAGLFALSTPHADSRSLSTPILDRCNHGADWATSGPAFLDGGREHRLKRAQVTHPRAYFGKLAFGDRAGRFVSRPGRIER